MESSFIESNSTRHGLWWKGAWNTGGCAGALVKHDGEYMTVALRPVIQDVNGYMYLNLGYYQETLKAQCRCIWSTERPGWCVSVLITEAWFFPIRGPLKSIKYSHALHLLCRHQYVVYECKEEQDLRLDS